MKFLRERKNKDTGIQPTPAEESASITRLEKAIQRRKHNSKLAFTLSWLSVVGELATMPIMIYSVNVDTAAHSLKVLLIWAISSLLAYSTALGYVWRGKKELERATADLLGCTSYQAIGPLIEVVGFYGPYNATGKRGNDYKAYQAAVQILIPLLPRLAAEEEYSTLTSVQQRHELPYVLRHAANPLSRRRYSVPFALAILKALEQIGDSTAIPTVERLAKMKPVDEDQRLLQAGAEICLSRLRERSQEVEQQSSLLRASSAIPTNTLLRAANGTTTTDPMQLLRAGQKDHR